MNGEAPYDVSAFMFDAIVAFALAVRASGDPTNSAAMFDALQEVSFEGASGSVRFDSATNRDANSFTFFSECMPTLVLTS